MAGLCHVFIFFGLSFIFLRTEAQDTVQFQGAPYEIYLTEPLKQYNVISNSFISARHSDLTTKSKLIFRSDSPYFELTPTTENNGIFSTKLKAKQPLTLRDNLAFAISVYDEDNPSKMATTYINIKANLKKRSKSFDTLYNPRDDASGECRFDYDNEILETGEILKYVDKHSEGRIESIKTKYVTKVSIESEKYVRITFQDPTIEFILTEEYKNLYANNFKKYSVKMKFKCGNGEFKYLRFVLINDDYINYTTIYTTSFPPSSINTNSSTASTTSDPEIKKPPKFLQPYFEFNLSMPLEANTIINATTVIVEDSDKDKKNIVFQVLGEYNELFEFIPATVILNKIYMTKLKTRKHIDLKDDISFNIMATNTAMRPLSTSSYVNLKIEKKGNENNSTKTYKIETESKSVYIIKVTN